MSNDDLYIIQSDVTGMIKVGRSKNPCKRLKQLQTGNPNKLRLIASFEGEGWKEKMMHEFFISFFFFFAVLFYNTFLSYISVYQNLSSVTICLLFRRR